MRMLSANLIPAARREALRVASRARLWAGVLAAASACMAIACAALFNTVGVDADDLRAQLDRVAADHAAADTDLKRSRADLAASMRLLGAASEVRDHPDWSALLSTMAALRGDQVVLATLDITPLDARAGEATVTRPARYALRLSGVARDHKAATSFSLLLERTGVFSRVTLTDTTSQLVGERAVVAFGLECALDEATGGGDAP